TDPTTATDRRVEGGCQWLFFAEKPGKIIRQAPLACPKGGVAGRISKRSGKLTMIAVDFCRRARRPICRCPESLSQV
ncbi:hypothetical protein, partial [Martelella sp. AD-3]|uniref:hypothetical protein n=1 Tax=Martelella sp. AD-3 TaxID=686597 RepID=UPI001AEC5838